MLRNKSSRALVASKQQQQALMADQSSLVSPSSSPITSFLNSPRFFNVFFSRKSEKTNSMSPTSILDIKNSSFVNPFGFEPNQTKPISQILEISDNNSSKSETQAIGLALIDSLIEEKSKVLFGSKLKVQIPPITTNPQSDFGIKTPNSQLLSPLSGGTKDFKRQLSLKEMELSEDYTCVVSHGPNPKTTHIFDNCIVKSCSDNDDTDTDTDDDDEDDIGFVAENKEMERGFGIKVLNSPSVNFLSFCYNCKDSLGQGKDIYMYRGEKAFCSQECRGQEMLLEMRSRKSDGDI